MDYGTIELNKLLDAFKNMSKEEYLSLFENASKNKPSFEILIEDTNIEVTYFESTNKHDLFETFSYRENQPILIKEDTSFNMLDFLEAA